jgi:hypothetical protein
MVAGAGGGGNRRRSTRLYKVTLVSGQGRLRRTAQMPAGLDARTAQA